MRIAVGRAMIDGDTFASDGASGINAAYATTTIAESILDDTSCETSPRRPAAG